MQFTVAVIIFAALALAGFTWASIRGGAITAVFVAVITAIAFGIFYWAFGQAS